jgi:hypothetical protein
MNGTMKNTSQFFDAFRIRRGRQIEQSHLCIHRKNTIAAALCAKDQGLQRILYCQEGDEVTFPVSVFGIIDVS